MALTSDAVEKAVVRLVDDKLEWQGGAGELYELLRHYRYPGDPVFWPNSSISLGVCLNYLSGYLLSRGVRIESMHTRTGTVWHLEWVGHAEAPRRHK